MTFEDMVRSVHQLTMDERKQLISLLVDSLTEPHLEAQTHTILEFEGIAAHQADDEDPQQYIKRLCQEWNDRP
ncbi:MAG TPA: hypothetical protein VHP14_23735 [Anaerolineales bacterium]|nr:hypothetical protein [Anaerolineales bacterium]